MAILTSRRSHCTHRGSEECTLIGRKGWDGVWGVYALSAVWKAVKNPYAFLNSPSLRCARDGLPPLIATSLIKPSLKSPIGNNHLCYSKSFRHAHPRTRHSAPGTICLFAPIKKRSLLKSLFFFLLLVKLHSL